VLLMSECRNLESLLATFVDGDASPDTRRVVEAHLAACAPCRQAVEMERAAHGLLRSRAAALETQAPPGLRTRLLAASREERRRASADALSWRGRFAAFSAAAVLTLALGAASVPVLTSYSTVLFAAQLALDHLKCFALDGHVHLPGMTAHEAERQLSDLYGWDLQVPEGSDAHDLRIVAVRRCLYGDGRAAHVLYRQQDTPISLFMLPGVTRVPDEVATFGHASRIWTREGVTYVLVVPSSNPGVLADVARHMGNEAE
jgi:anti-sigma factor (TIGR02949 family)